MKHQKTLSYLLIISFLMVCELGVSQCKVELPGWYSQTPIQIDQNLCMSRANVGLFAFGSGNIEGQAGWTMSGYKGDMKAGISCLAVNGGTMASVVVATPASQWGEAMAFRDQLKNCILNGECNPTSTPVIVSGIGRGEEKDDEEYQKIDWIQTASGLGIGSKEDSIFCYECQKLGPQSTPGRVWGTLDYTSDSAICPAAKHAGEISDEGGVVCLRIKTGTKRFINSTSNGVITNLYGSPKRSFEFISEANAAAARTLADRSFVQPEETNVSDWKVDYGKYEIKDQAIDAFPAGDGKTSYYVAPDNFLGNWTQFSQLSFQKKSWGGSYYGPDSYGAYGDIVIRNGSKTARYDLNKEHSGNWRTYNVSFRDAGWKLTGGANSVNDVLMNVTEFKIRAEYGSGTDYSGLSDVRVW